MPRVSYLSENHRRPPASTASGVPYKPTAGSGSGGTVRSTEEDSGTAPVGPELPAPVLKLRLEATELAGSGGEQLELVRAEGDARRGRLKQGLRQVKAAVGAGGVSMVVEVAPWSRIPEARALLVPRDD